MNHKDLAIISSLRRNARETLTSMSRTTRIPVSTLFDRIRQHENNLIKKHTTIIDFAKLGFSTRANIMLKVKKQDRDLLREFLLRNNFINSAYKINNGYDFMVEVIFRNMKELEDFIENLEEKFGIQSKQVYYVIDELKKEEFLCNSMLLSLDAK